MSKRIISYVTPKLPDVLENIVMSRWRATAQYSLHLSSAESTLGLGQCAPRWLHANNLDSLDQDNTASFLSAHAPRVIIRPARWVTKGWRTWSRWSTNSKMHSAPSARLAILTFHKLPWSEARAPERAPYWKTSWESKGQLSILITHDFQCMTARWLV